MNIHEALKKYGEACSEYGRLDCSKDQYLKAKAIEKRNDLCAKIVHYSEETE